MTVQLFPRAEETIDGASRAIREGRRSCVEVLEACLAQIDKWEPRVRAWVSVDRDGALRRAAELDAELAAGRWRGPLHGIPLGIKDIIDMEGLPTAAGSRLLAGRIAAEDAPLVARLRSAGAVLVGKTVTTQFASFDPPITRNPWNPQRTPGGSSSGSAAAVATGMCLGAVGSQTGGSITRPASYCGVAGCKPTFGRVSVRGVLPLAPSMDHPGPIARTVGDLALLLDVLAGYDDRDPWSADAPLFSPPLSKGGPGGVKQSPMNPPTPPGPPLVRGGEKSGWMGVTVGGGWGVTVGGGVTANPVSAGCGGCSMSGRNPPPGSRWRRPSML